MVVFKETVEISKELFLKYYKIQTEGKYNMFMDAKKVISILGCTEAEYKSILNNYTSLAAKYL